MDIAAAQKDMREAYFNGSTGALVSGLVWLMAGILAFYTDQKTALIVFLVGGMMIFPVSVVLDKLLGRSGKHDPKNPLGQLALETTVNGHVDARHFDCARRLYPAAALVLPLYVTGDRWALFVFCQSVWFETLLGFRGGSGRGWVFCLPALSHGRPARRRY